MTNIFNFNKKIRQRMSRKDNCWEDVTASKVTESFFKTIKYEWLSSYKYKSYQELYSSIDEYISWYNTKQLHASLVYLGPLEIILNNKP